MRITILGSGASEGIPAFLCHCPVCAHARRARGKEIRQNSFVLVTSRSNESLLIDVPPHFKMSWDQERLRDEALLAVLVTHRHDDHSLGLHYLWDAPVQDAIREEQPLPVYMPSDVFELRVRPYLLASAASEASRKRFVRAKVVHAYREFPVGPFAVTPLETNHLGAAGAGSAAAGGPGAHPDRAEDFGYLVQDSDSTRIAYIVDAPSTLPERTLERLRAGPLDCLLLECTFAACTPAQGHTDVPRLCALQEQLQPRLMIATHIGHANDTHRRLRRTLRPHGIRVAFDGMSVSV